MPVAPCPSLPVAASVGPGRGPGPAARTCQEPEEGRSALMTAGFWPSNIPDLTFRKQDLT